MNGLERGPYSIKAVREIIAALPAEDRCDPECPGWAVFSVECSSRVPNGTLESQRCDSCFGGSAEEALLWDDDVEQLPEAKEELKRMIGEQEEAERKRLLKQERLARRHGKR